MSNPQDNKRSDQQNEKPKSGQQPNEPGTKPESRHGQGGRPAEGQEIPKKKNSTDEDVDADDEGNR